MPSQVTTILQAIDFAAQKHRDQRRKGRNCEPYINHPIEVAKLISEIGGISDIDILVAAILHDTIEDTDTTEEEISKMFGAEAASLVKEVTDDKSLSKTDRKKLQVEHAPHLSRGAKIIKLADKISNIADIIDNPPDGWSNERRRDYVKWGRAVIAGLKDSNAQLEDRFHVVAESAISTIDS